MSRDLILIFLAMFAWGLGEGMFYIFQPLYLESLGADPLLIGGIFGLWGVSMLISHVPAGYLADRIGRRPVLWAAWSIGTVATGLMALANSLPVFVTGLLLYGITAFALAPINSYITAARGRLSVGRVITLVSAVYHIGAIAGPFLGGYIAERSSLRVVYIGSAGVFVVSTLLVFLLGRQPVEARPQEETHRRLSLNNRFGVFLGIIFMVFFAAFLPQPLTPNFLESYHGLAYDQIGRLGSTASLGVVVFNLVFGQFQPRFGLLFGQAAAAVFALILWKGTGMPLFTLAFFMLGGYRTARSMAAAHTRSMVPAAHMGLAYGLVESVGAGAMIAAPLLAGYLYQHDPTLVYIFAVGLSSLALIASLLFLSQSARFPAAIPPEADTV